MAVILGSEAAPLSNTAVTNKVVFLFPGWLYKKIYADSWELVSGLVSKVSECTNRYSRIMTIGKENEKREGEGQERGQWNGFLYCNNEKNHVCIRIQPKDLII